MISIYINFQNIIHFIYGLKRVFNIIIKKIIKFVLKIIKDLYFLNN
jgi:hypothetical protein